MCTCQNSRHLDRMTRRSDKCDLCVYEYINRTGGAAVHRNGQNQWSGKSCAVCTFAIEMAH